MSATPPPRLEGIKSPTVTPAAVSANLPVASNNNVEESKIFSPSLSKSSIEGSTHCYSYLQGKTFAQKIYKLLELPNNSSIISWNGAGDAVIIHDVDAFINTLMPMYFQQSKFGSFIRRMRRWGFSVIKQRSPDKLSSERGGQSNVMEFSSEHFIRDQPELVLMMKDERQLKRKVALAEPRRRRKVDAFGHVSNQRLPLKVSGHLSLQSVESFGMPPASIENVQQPTPVRYPQSSNMNTVTNLSGTNVLMNDGFLQNYSQESSMLPLSPPMNQYTFQSTTTMPMMDMMPPFPQANPPLGGGFGGFGSAPPAFQYSMYAYPSYLQPQQQQQQGYSSYLQQQPPQQQQQQQQMMMQQQMMQQNQQQHEMMQLNQQQQAEMHYPPYFPFTSNAVAMNPSTAAINIADSASTTGNEDIKASNSSVKSQLLSSGSDDSSTFDLLPNTLHQKTP